MIKQLVIAVIAAFLITILGHYYLYMRIIAPFYTESDYWSSGWATVFSALWIVTFFGFLILRILPLLLRKTFEIFMFSWMGIGYIFLLVCLLTAPLSLVFHYFQFSDITLSLFVISVSALLTIWTIYKVFRPETFVPISIPLAHKKEVAEKLRDLKIVVLSDVHVSGLITKKRVERYIKRINELDPDVIFITGDMMDGSVWQLKNDMMAFAALKPKRGIFYVTGNHEYYSGPDNWKSFFDEKLGWKILSNQNGYFEYNGVKINVIGIEDKHWLNHEKIPKANDRRIDSATEGLNFTNDEVFILLAHQPKDAKVLKNYPHIDLQISGHTHGGQLWPLHYIVRKDQVFVAGLYPTQFHPNQWIYVTQGTGFWGPPMRLGTDCEITVMTFSS